MQLDTIFYHGTDRKGLLSILTEGRIGVNYYDVVGLYLTHDFECANNHGQYVLVFQNIDVSNLETDDVNDGFFHKGYLAVDQISKIITYKRDRRIAVDLIEYLLEEIRNE